MSFLNFKFENGEAYVLKGDGKKKISKEVLTDICYLLLGNIAEPRDYSSVTSVTKLLRIIDVECQPDESDAEDDAVADTAQADAAPTNVKTDIAQEPKTNQKPAASVKSNVAAKKPVAATAKKSVPPPADSSESSEDE